LSKNELPPSDAPTGAAIPDHFRSRGARYHDGKYGPTHTSASASPDPARLTTDGLGRRGRIQRSPGTVDGSTGRPDPTFDLGHDGLEIRIAP